MNFLRNIFKYQMLNLKIITSFGVRKTLNISRQFLRAFVVSGAWDKTLLNVLWVSFAQVTITLRELGNSYLLSDQILEQKFIFQMNLNPSLLGNQIKWFKMSMRSLLSMKFQKPQNKSLDLLDMDTELGTS